MDRPGISLHIRVNPKRVRALFQGHVIADTDNALTVFETGYAPVQYFPRKDVDMAFFGKTSHRTSCAHKGQASYFTLVMDGQIAENAAWSYEDPILAASALQGRIAFYRNVVEVSEHGPSPQMTEPRAFKPRDETAGR